MVVKLIDKPRKAPLEKAVQAKIIKWLRGFFAFSGDVITKNMYGSNGIADIVGTWHGKYVAIEVKRDANGTPTPQQKLWLHEKSVLAEIVGIAYSIECVKEIFEKGGITLDNEPRKS